MPLPLDSRSGAAAARFVRALVGLLLASALLVSARGQGAFVSDDFNRCGGPDPLWTAVDPAKAGAFSIIGAGTSDARLVIDVAPGVDADAWNFNNAPRLLQSALDVDFSAELRIDTAPSERYQLAGLLVEQDPDNWLRFDFYSDGNRLWCFTGATVDGVSQAVARTRVQIGGPLYLRVTRTGVDWIHEFSSDGATWEAHSAFTHPLAVTSVGPFAGATRQAPGFHAEFDYFFEAASPIVPEDGSPGGLLSSLSTATTGPGLGDIVFDPVQAGYTCGQSVLVTAVPQQGSSFSGWTGSLAGQPNPATIVVGGDESIGARFDLGGPPVITNVAVDPGVTTATVSWTTDKPASSHVNYGPVGSLGESASDPALVSEHSILLTGLLPDSVYEFVVSSTTAGGETTAASASVFATSPSVGPVSDDFNACEIGSAWTLIDPVGGATAWTQGAGTSDASLVIDVPAGMARDAWSTNRAARLMQSADDVDMDLEVAFTSDVSERYQMQGILVEQDSDNWLRFDVYHDGAVARAFAAVTTNGASESLFAATVPTGPIALRVERVGDHWSQAWSADGGATWTAAAEFDHALSVTSAGIFAGITGPAPAFTLAADYFEVGSDPLIAEDAGSSGGLYSIATSTVGSGGGVIVLDPPTGPYTCGQAVTFTAAPDAGSVFSGWVGDLSGGGNPTVVQVSSDLIATGRFELAGPPAITNVEVSPAVRGATVSWTTDRVATSRIDFGPTQLLGQFVESGQLVTEHVIELAGLEPGTTYSFEVTSIASSGAMGLWGPSSLTTVSTLGPVADDFNRCQGLDSRWELLDPIGGVTVDIEGAGTSQALAVIDVPGGIARDAWGANNSARLLQAADDVDFAIEVGFTSMPQQAYQMQGVLIDGGPDDWLRFDYYSDGSDLRVFAAKTINGSSTAEFNQSINPTPELQMRIVRTGDTWTQSWSSDGGATWTQGAAFVQPLQVEHVGPFAGVAGTESPAFRMEVDYFDVESEPLVVEDGPISTGPFEIDYPGDGTVIVDPPLNEYFCADEVTITVVPPAGQVFAGWAGDLAGQAGSLTIRMGESLELIPVFEPTPPPIITGVVAAAGATTALVRWTTDLPASSRVDYGSTSGYGQSVSSAIPTMEHELLLAGLQPGSTYHYRVTSTSDGGQSAVSGDNTFTTTSIVAGLSTDFNRANLDQSRWSFQDPRQDTKLRIEGVGTADAELVLELQEGVRHDLWAENTAPRVVQLVPDEDLDVAVKMENRFDSSYQMQGLVFVGNTDGDFVRVEFHHDGNRLNVFAATAVGGVPSGQLLVPVFQGEWAGAPLYLRVTRDGVLWTVYSSLSVDEGNLSDPGQWSQAGAFVHSMQLTALGLFAGNAGGNPDHVARFDWLFDTLQPVPGEDQAPEVDVDPPFIYRSSATVQGSDSTRIEWWTDEVAIGEIRYGLTSALEIGPVDAGAAAFGQAVVLSQLLPDTTYHYQVMGSDGALETLAPPGMFTTTAVGTSGDAPVIDVWYVEEAPDGVDEIAFGENGLGQAIANVLGNVSDPNGDLALLEYTLDGDGPWPLSVGPDSRRLLSPGDFNIEIPIGALNPGPNTVVVRAADSAGNTVERLVRVQYTPSSVGVAPGTIDWSTVASITDVTQVVDGQWAIDGARLRNVDVGYDRLVVFGDHRWNDFEIEVPVMIESVDSSGFLFPSNYPLVGFALRWPGHSSSGTQPNWGFWPMGALANFRWDTLSASGRCEMRGNQNTAYQNVPCNLEAGVEYILKARVTTGAGGSSLYQFKMWESAESEPGWTLEFSLPAGNPSDPSSNPATGSIGLLAHHVQASFGPVSLNQLSGQ